MEDQKEFYIRLAGWQLIPVRDGWEMDPSKDACWFNDDVRPFSLYTLTQAYIIEVDRKVPYQ
jgi:hypothetical protein